MKSDTDFARKACIKCLRAHGALIIQIEYKLYGEPSLCYVQKFFSFLCYVTRGSILSPPLMTFETN